MSAEVHETTLGIDHRKLGIWTFLGSEFLFFGAFISAYLLYLDTTANAPGVEIFDIPFTSISSFVLLMSSLTMVLAVAAIGRGDHQKLRTWLLATALLGGIFISGQVYEFQLFVKEGMGFTTNAASTAFFTLTGFHGVHVTIGIVMLISAFLLSARGRIPTGSESIEIVGLYWHFVDVVWILIFTVVYLIK